MKNSTKEAWVGGKNISEEAMMKRRKINKKIFKFGCLPIVVIVLVFMILGVIIESTMENDTANPRDPMNIGRQNLKSLIGQEFSQSMLDTLGEAATIDESDIKYLITYINTANASFLVNRSTQIIEYAAFGRNSASNYLAKSKQERFDKVEAQFSAWNGSHINLTKLIKQNMNDPSSYEHISTNYWDMNDHLVVLTKYRGNNAFGGKVAGYVKAKVDLNGNVIEIMENE